MDENSDNDPEFLPEDTFSECDSSDHVNLKKRFNFSRINTSKSRSKDNKRSQLDDTQSKSDSRSKNRKVQEQLE